MTGESLWPEDLVADYIKTLDTPVGILRHQGALLAGKTSGKLRAIVESDGTNGYFLHKFVIQSMRYANFKHTLFTVTHGIALFPVHTLIDGSSSHREWQNKESFCGELRTIFASNHTSRVICGLMAQIE